MGQWAMKIFLGSSILLILCFDNLVRVACQLTKEAIWGGCCINANPILGDILNGLPMQLFSIFSSSMRSGWHFSVMTL